MLRKLATVTFVMAMMVMGMAGMAQAANPAVADIQVRCLAPLSVSITGSPTNYNFLNVEAASTTYSGSPVVFRNDSIGAICKWTLQVDTESLKDAQTATQWTMGAAPGLNRVALFGLFKRAAAIVDGDFVAADALDTIGKEYSATNFHFNDYDTYGYNNDAAKVLPKTYTDTDAAKDCDRKLWLKFQTPLAVTDVNQRTIKLMVTAQMAN